MRTIRLFVVTLLFASATLAHDFAIIINGDTQDKCRTHQINVSLATDALLAHGFQVVVAHDRWEIRKAIDKARMQLTDQSSLVVYTTGHGKENKLVLDSGSISSLQLTQEISTLRYRHLYYLGDQCFSKTFSNKLDQLPKTSGVGTPGLSRCEPFSRPRWNQFRQDGNLDRLVRGTP